MVSSGIRLSPKQEELQYLGREGDGSCFLIYPAAIHHRGGDEPILLYRRDHQISRRPSCPPATERPAITGGERRMCEITKKRYLVVVPTRSSVEGSER